MKQTISREAALNALREYNKEPFHIQHALTVEGAISFSRGSPNPGIEPRSPAWQADSLPAEPQK